MLFDYLVAVLLVMRDLLFAPIGGSTSIRDFSVEQEIHMRICAPLSPLLVCLALLVTGCASASWTYGGQTFTTSQAALEAARQDVRRSVSTVPRKERSGASSILVFAPSIAWSRQGVVTTGAANAEQVNYIATVLYYGYRGMAEAIERRNFFASTDIREFDQRDPLANPQYDYLLWLRLDGPNSAQWMVAPGKDTSAPRAINISPISDSTDRLSQFVESVEKYVTMSDQ